MIDLKFCAKHTDAYAYARTAHTRTHILSILSAINDNPDMNLNWYVGALVEVLKIKMEILKKGTIQTCFEEYGCLI